MQLAGKIALVTGAARGIGRAIAVALAQEGADVAVADVRTDLLEETAARVQEHGRRSLALGVDVTRKAEVAQMVAQTVAAFGRIDVFFNNAGIIKIHDFLDITEEDWDTIMAVNAKGVFLCAQAVARQMVRQGGGKIINTASIAARQGVPDSAVYAASKAAVMSLTRSMALSLAPHGITVNALAPGMVDTDMWALIDAQTAALRGLPPGEPRARRIRRIPLGRPAQPEDIARVAVFLASSSADYLTGQTLNIDGGTIMS
ncbi:MAG: sorbitol dehydrogenase [Candidatus Tectimicrobiota bacterium]|nr:MAG: sorbitol dehydrogenase [Candidatus Tectomicrobia bacterium]